MATIRAATLNIWNRMGAWEDRLRVIRHHLEALAPDVLALQEVIRLEGEYEVNQAEDIARGFGYHIAFGRGIDAKPWGLGNAILSKWPITRTLTFGLPGTDEARSVVFAEVDSPTGKLPVFSTHLNWKLDEGHIRQLQVRALASFVASVSPANVEDVLPPIVMGDFNAEPDSDEIRFMRGHTSLNGTCVYYADSFALSGDGSAGITFSRTNPNALTLREPNRRIDYVFVRGPDEKLRGEPLEARVCFDTPLGDVWASDHFGVVATISA
jgi:endonuclease/exonuclease/phosphatase family metal-dependent hydrolase